MTPHWKHMGGVYLQKGVFDPLPLSAPRGAHVGVNLTTGERRGDPTVNEPPIDDDDTVPLAPDDLPPVRTVLMATGEIVETPRIDPALEALIPPLSPEERALLKASIDAEGVRDAAIVWSERNTLIEGHNRYHICAELDKPLPIRFMSFDCREAVIVWMLEKQLGQRNLTDPSRIKLALELEPAYAELAKARQSAAAVITNAKLGRNDTTTLVPNLAQASDGTQSMFPQADAGKSRDAAAKTAGVSHGTYDKGKYIVNNAPAWIVARWEREEFSTHGAYELAKRLAKAPLEVRDCVERHQANVPAKKLTDDLIEFLEFGFTNKRDWFDELYRSGGVQPEGEQTRRTMAHGVTGLQAAVKLKEKNHRQSASDDRKQRQLEQINLLPNEVVSVVYADVAWEYDNSGLNGAAEKHYPTMPTDAVCTLPEDIGLRIAPNAVLFLWATNPLLEDALRVMAAWGFEYKTNIVWVKSEDRGTYGRLGFYVSGAHELLLIGTRGSFLPVHLPLSVIDSRKRDHSRKPDLHDLIERMYPDQRYVELFARAAAPRSRWTFWGNEAHARAE